MYILPHVEQVPWVGLPPIQHQPYRANGFWHNASGWCQNNIHDVVKAFFFPLKSNHFVSLLVWTERISPFSLGVSLYISNILDFFIEIIIIHGWSS